MISAAKAERDCNTMDQMVTKIVSANLVIGAILVMAIPP